MHRTNFVRILGCQLNPKVFLFGMPLTPGSIIDVQSPAVFERWLITSLRSFGSAEGIRRIVVPSESLRQHWVRRIAGACRATVGVEVCTHKRFARMRTS